MHGTKYMDTNKNFNQLQHGFKKRLSCDSQLLSLFHDFASGPSETDLIVMDFSKAFDKVPQRRFLYKLEWYGIRGGTLDWIRFFLTDRTQKLVLDGADRVSTGTCYVGSTSGFGSGPYPFPNLYKWSTWWRHPQYSLSVRRWLYFA